MKTVLRSWIVCVLVLASATSYADDKVEAAKLFDLGKRHYNLNEWDDAIAQFKSAYKLFPDPVYLFNIAQAYRLKGTKSCALSAQFYASYLRVEK
jgi:tetratricopeptide (TPR) repeat protein